MKDDIVNNVNELFEEHYEEIGAFVGEFVDQFEDFNCEEEEGCSTYELQKFFQQLVIQREMFLGINPSGSSILGRWYELIESIDCILDENDFFQIPVEENLIGYAENLHNYCKSLILYKNPLDYHETIWLVQLKRIIRERDWWSNIDSRKYLYWLFEEFNKRYKFK